jgi:hypothetical protein
VTDRQPPDGESRPIPARTTGPGEPVKDLGSAAVDDWRCAFNPGDSPSADIFEKIEFAGVAAENRVYPFLRSTTKPFGLGRATIGLRFHDSTTLRLFLRSGVLTGQKAFGAYLMTRAWAGVSDDVRLDEHMTFVVANRLQADFSGLLEVTVFIRHFDWRDVCRSGPIRSGEATRLTVRRADEGVAIRRPFQRKPTSRGNET